MKKTRAFAVLCCAIWIMACDDDGKSDKDMSVQADGTVIGGTPGGMTGDMQLDQMTAANMGGMVISGPACADLRDNDGDGLIDLDDDGCDDANDEDEATAPKCQNQLDDDEDGLIDFPADPGCGSARDNNETNEEVLPECNDGIDNDRDGYTDEEDSGCSSSSDIDENMAQGTPQCSDLRDNDGDLKADFPYDPGCSAAGDEDEVDPLRAVECVNGMDDDNDGKIDFPYDPGCSGYGDRSEADGVTPPGCSDGMDNDRDGKIDYPDDDGCIAASDYNEKGSCGNTYDPPKLSNGLALTIDTSRGVFESQGSCGGQGSPELVVLYRLTHAVEALEISTVSPVTSVPTTLYVRKEACLTSEQEIACQREEQGKAQNGHALTIPNLSAGDYYIYVDGVAGAGGLVDIIVNEKPLAECLNGIDDNQDGRTDYPLDPACTEPADRDEGDFSPSLCSNDEDDDNDGKVDYPLDPGCLNAAWQNESDVCGVGVNAQVYFYGQEHIIVNTNTSNSTYASNELSGSCGGQQKPEVVILYRNPHNARLVINTSYPETQSPSVIYMRTECGNTGTEIRCNDGTAAGASSGRVVINQAAPGDYWIVIDTKVGVGGIVKMSISSERLDPPCEGGIGPDSDLDGICNDAAQEIDDDNDTVNDTVDIAPTNPERCQDLDMDGCDDCSAGLGMPAVATDGPDLDMDGLCDTGDSDKDGDGTPNNIDNCQTLANEDQLNTDGDMNGNACDEDDDADGVLDSMDINATDPLICADRDNDLCDDCSVVRRVNVNNDGLDTDRDGKCDFGDTDDDNDMVLDEVDNCTLLSNRLQENLDGDQFGDLCDDDDDGDQVIDTMDNCVGISNPDQSNLDGDTQGDACDNDDDNDQVNDELDNCPIISNQDQSNVDGDAFGDLCDSDKDGDQIDNQLDNCPEIANADQLNTDADQFGDLCDDDDDNDMIADMNDNCIVLINPLQENYDMDQFGDLCDDDDDNDLVIDTLDSNPFDVNLCSDLDMDSCDDCAIRKQQDIQNDGLDTDIDGMCDQGDIDDDNDNLNDFLDNCSLIANEDQLNTDGDQFGDLCDDDVDGDNVLNNVDNCPALINADQLNTDGDQFGDACDDDLDGDGTSNATDNCSMMSNADQLNTDSDAFGNVCDDDDDGDLQNDIADNCPLIINADQIDSDSDGFGDVCDNCPNKANIQVDTDNDGLGNACDEDDDGDNVQDDLDLCPTVPGANNGCP